MDRKLGCNISPKDARDYVYSATYKEFPESFELNTGKILNQGNVGSCVAHSVCETVSKMFDDKEFSRGWIYGRRPDGSTCSGMYIKTALKTAQKEGCVPYDYFPYNIEMLEIKNKVDSEYPTLKNYANNYKIGSYARIYGTSAIKSALMEGYPVVFAINIYESYLEYDKNYIVKIPDNNESIIGGHCMIIYGWDKNGFKFQNSWGKDWGKNGCAILPYSYNIPESYVVEPLKSENGFINKPKMYFFRKIIEFIKKIFKK